LGLGSARRAGGGADALQTQLDVQAKPVYKPQPELSHLEHSELRFPGRDVASSEGGGADVQVDEEGSQQSGNGPHDGKHGKLPDVVVIALPIQRQVVIIQPAARQRPKRALKERLCLSCQIERSQTG